MIDLPPTTDHYLTEWTPAAYTAMQVLPITMRDWLTDRGSLTKKLSLAYKAPIKVRVLEQSWQTPFVNEMVLLQYYQNKDTRFVVRRVQLLVHNQPVIYARSVFPHSCVSFLEKTINKFSSVPLGRWLFAQKPIRHEFEYIHVRGENLAIDSGAEAKEHIWGRRSVFTLPHCYPILVTEYFLTTPP